MQVGEEPMTRYLTIRETVLVHSCSAQSIPFGNPVLQVHVNKLNISEVLHDINATSRQQLIDAIQF